MPRRQARSLATRRALRRVAAAGVFVAVAVLVVGPLAQAFQIPGAKAVAYDDLPVAQQLDVDMAHGAEDITGVLTRDDFSVNDAIASQRFDDVELAQLQAVADSQTVQDPWDGEPSLSKVWQQLETSYTQSPFPSIAEVPVSSKFGYRWGGFHGGVDLVPGSGTPVFPIANGVVVQIYNGANPGGGGYEVHVEHNIDGRFYQSWYPHLTAGSIDVEVGQVVDIGTQIGTVGSTGNSTGPHLHLEIKNDDYISFDPLIWLATREQVLEP